MNHFSRILVAVDFSEPARNAFEYALALGKRDGARLVVLQAVPPDERFSWHDHERRTLAARLRQRGEEAGVEVDSRIQRGEPAEIILLHARSLSPGAIVMGTHQRRGIDRVRGGSIAERVVAKATVPVLLVPPGSPGAATRPLGHVAVAVDFGAGTDRALARAAALASRPDDRITLLHAVARSASALPVHLLGYGSTDSAPMVRDAQQRLEALADRVKRHTPAAIHTRVVTGDTATAIARALDDIGAGLVIVGVPQRGVFARTLFRTTAIRLLRAVDVPMLAIPYLEAGTADQTPDVHQLAA